jgi:nucleotide-binding universal stress UspA family protein
MRRRVREQSAEFLVLSTHGTSPADGGAGTLAMACARKASTSVLLVKEPHAGPFVSIVACVGFSATSRRALEAAVRFAVQDRAVLHVLHVFDAPWHRLHYRAPTPQASPDYQKQYRDGLRRQLEAFCEPYQDEMARLEDLMSRGAVCVEADDPITVAVDTMIEARPRSPPVVERRPGGPVLIGIVSRTDVLPYLTLESDDAP